MAFTLFSIVTVAQVPLRIMPLGNSITRGSMCVNGDIYSCVLNADSDAVGYRYRLYNLLNTAGYNFDFVGKHKYGYAIMDDPDNSGFDGIRSWNLADVMETGTSTFTGQVTAGPYLNYYPADIILLHIGTNDVLAGQTSVADVSRILDAIDTYENATGQPVLVFLATIISERNYPCNTHPGTVAFNNNLVSMAQTRIQNGDHLVLVDMECGAGLNYYNDLTDQVHPDADGYSKMGDMWFQAIDSYNTPPVISSIPAQTTLRGTPFDTLNLDNYVTDAENTPDQLTWSAVTADPQNFTVSINSNRQVIVTPKDTAWSGSETLQFAVTDRGKVLTALKKSDTVSIVYTVEWMPEIIGQANLSTPEETALAINPSDLVIVEPEKAPAGLTLQVLAGGNYTVDGTTITPSVNFNGTLSVPVRLSVDGKVSNTYDLQVDVTPVNDPPVFVSQNTITTDRNVPVKITIDDIVYSDPDNVNAEHAFAVLPGTNYTLQGDTVVPATDYYGDLTVNALLSDLQDTVYFQLLVNVNYQNIPPQFVSVPVTSATEGEAYTYVLQATDVDVEDPNINQALTYWADSIPGWLIFNPGNDVLVGLPSNADVGDYRVRMGVTDGIDSVYQAFSLTVQNVNNPPVISGQKDTIKGIVNSYVILNIDELVIEDPDNQPGDMSLIILPGNNYTFDGDSVFFARDYKGLVTVDLMVNDGQDDSNVFGATIKVDFGEGIFVPSNDMISRIYPNPASDYVSFELKNILRGSLEIRDITGKRVFLKRDVRSGERITLDVSRFAKGIYIFRVDSGNKFQVGKLIVN